MRLSVFSFCNFPGGDQSLPQQPTMGLEVSVLGVKIISTVFQLSRSRHGPPMLYALAAAIFCRTVRPQDDSKFVFH
jgi:hypothetical protein